MKALRSNTIITPAGIRPGILLLDKGVILDILNEIPSDIPVSDLGNKILMPGIIDPHVHINEPGRTEWEGFDTATKAALAGGISTVVEMPLNSSPVTTSLASYQEKIRAARGRIHCHCSFWGGLVPGNEKEIEPMIDSGVRGFKAFLVHSGIDDFPAVSENDLRKVMPVLARNKKPLLVHCEIESSLPGIDHPDPRSYNQYLQSRPKKWEDDAIEMMIRLCEEFSCPVHIVHLSSAASLEQISKAKQKGLPLTVETAQHYLFFSAEKIPDGSPSFKCAPPIREKENNEKLWGALKVGLIDFVATDHSPAPSSMKEMDTGNLQKAWGGIAGLQFSLPVLWTAARARGYGPELICQWLCEKPALLPGFSVKGRIEKGFDADLAIWDPEKNFIVTEEIIRHRHKITPYLGEKLTGVVEQVYLAGELVFQEGNYLHLNKGNIYS